jgi:hypothetical protein
VLEDEAFVEEELEDNLALVDPAEEIIDPEDESLELPELLEVSSSPVKLSGGGPDSTKPSSPRTVPGRLYKAGFIEWVLKLEEEVQEPVVVEALVVFVSDTLLSEGVVVLGGALTKTLKLYEEVAFIASVRSTCMVCKPT